MSVKMKLEKLQRKRKQKTRIKDEKIIYSIYVKWAIGF